VSADGRFAPSPTGPLHLGSLRTALVAWLFARSQNARFLLRVEDLDPDRSRREHEARQQQDLRALGIDWDGGVVRQSERGALYQAALQRLADQDRLYPCYCTRAEIRAAASAPHGEMPEGAYPGTCRHLSAAQRRRREAAGRIPALRLRADRERISFEDRLLGPQTHVVDDFVVRRADGVIAYQLAVVVDDAEQGVGEVVRGADLVDSTPRQLLLFRLLELATPRYTHVPLVLGPDGARLAKRHGAATLADRHEPPSATLALLARSLGLADESQAVRSAADLIEAFDPARIPRQPVRFGPPLAEPSGYEDVRTARLRLLRIQPEHVPALLAISTDPRTNVYRPGGPPTPNESEDLLRSFIAGWHEEGIGYWTAMLGEQIIGIAGIRPIPHAGRECFNVYYRFAPEAQGQGYAAEAIRAALEAGRGLDPDRLIVARTRPDNKPAIRLAEKVGLRRTPGLDGGGLIAYA
jgi:glutamyl-tRNA synthetase